MAIPRPFRLTVSDDELADLQDRLAHARLLPQSPRRMPSGMTQAYLRELVDSWAGFDWRVREEWLAAHPQFLADVDGVELHFAHLRSARADAPALLVMHGWPHTFALQLDFADLLPDFDVVVPSLPGFGFSAPYPDRPANEAELAATMHSLMTEVLGYETYLTYGEDVSANVNDLLAAQHPDAVAGIIVTHAHFPTRAERAELDEPDAVAFFAQLAAGHEPNGAYGHAQATRPDTLAVGLNDSPAGLAAWIVEKIVEWADVSDADPSAIESRISRERLLTEAMIYWTSQSIATSFRTYYEGADQPAPIPPVEVPAAVFIQRHEHGYPESLARSFYRDLRVFERLAEGGHFTVAEVPAAMAERVRAFARDLGVLRVS
jgi:pimeloyl-ACP methyl ester carboxylesterase